MTRVTFAAIFAVLSAITAPAAASQTSSSTPSLHRQTGPTFLKPGKNPFKGIFGSRQQLVRPSVLLQNPTAFVVCGTTVMRGDSKVDAGILAKRKPDRRVDHKARIIEPKICRD